MKAQVRSRRVWWALLAVLAMAPVSLLAQQDDAAAEQSQPELSQTETPELQAEQEQELTEAPEVAEQSDEPQETTESGARTISGMSILGNQEAPTSLVIVPWRSSEIGDSVGVSTMLDDSRQPVDKEVFMRALRYYEIRSESRP